MQSIARAIPRALTELLQGTPLSQGKVEFAWKAAVGPALARGTEVRLQGATLLVEATTPAWAREVRRSAAIILKRMTALLGPDAIARIDVRR